MRAYGCRTSKTTPSTSTQSRCTSRTMQMPIRGTRVRSRAVSGKETRQKVRLASPLKSSSCWERPSTRWPRTSSASQSRVTHLATELPPCLPLPRFFNCSTTVRNGYQSTLNQRLRLSHLKPSHSVLSSTNPSPRIRGRRLKRAHRR